MNKILLILGATALVGLALAPAATAAPPQPNCYDIYNEYHAGPVTVYQYSSCEYDVHVDEDWEPTDELP